MTTTVFARRPIRTRERAWPAPILSPDIELVLRRIKKISDGSEATLGRTGKMRKPPHAEDVIFSDPILLDSEASNGFGGVASFPPPVRAAADISSGTLAFSL